MQSSRLTAQERYSRILDAAKSAGGDCLREVTALLGRNDLYFLLTRLLRRKDMQHDWLYERCLEVQQNPDGYIDLWAREHYKSTIITFGLTIQDILNDPEVTVGIFSCTSPIAKGFLKQIKYELESNEVLKQVYPDVLWENPGRDAPSWSLDRGITVKRKSNPKEATVEAHGLVDGQPTSRHYQKLVYDDVVTLESVSTPEMISKVTNALALSYNLGAHGGGRRFIGTRYHFNDTYKTILDRQTAIPRIYPATDNGKVDGVPVFLTREQLGVKRRDMGPYVFGCQMLQDPKADKAQGFLEEWLRYWEPKEEVWERGNIYILCDPAGEKKKDNDYTVFWVWALMPDLNFYCCKIIRDRLNLKERTDILFQLYKQFMRPGYKPVVGYEKYGKDSDIEHIEDEQERRGFRFDIIELGGPMPKNDRIRKMIPLYDAGRVYLPHRCDYVDREMTGHNLTQEFINDEYLAFPVASHDDMLDCGARVLDPKLGHEFPEEEDKLQFLQERLQGNQPYDPYTHLHGGR